MHYTIPTFSMTSFLWEAGYFDIKMFLEMFFEALGLKGID